MNDIKDCKILIVDDELSLSEMVKDIMLKEGFHEIFTASSCHEAITQFKKLTPHIVILDIMLPDGDGFSLMQKFRETSMVPILFLSAKDQDEDRLLGLGLGADDYITKPFLPRELILRLSIILKRTYFPLVGQANKKPTFSLGNTIVDMNSGTVKTQSEELTLTAKEYVLLDKLYTNKGNIVTIDALCKAAWGDDLFRYENTLMVHIRRLRAKIEPDPSHPKYLLTVRGLGYKLVLEA
ncbi:DNA-binding protein [Clostridium carboxidivorans P7]|uniref:Stage 0 sporulation protein A homolog n=1 Tax=Clostridium carboxidivorans P7 TaxID=536227 RepID=C6PS84_9CLOT|nr:response regulator transcription factor [Clostridium carboxidivorans]AKN33408.1 DNA-binding protein [Clostridium carboxidivorans P7]EET87881.1 two component transcriptional regulator, winged helix family [Clostridium carboxidivorans P7]EFG89212.1 putative regulatory protein VanR [Clostridium carboxidivorans P7]